MRRKLNLLLHSLNFKCPISAINKKAFGMSGAVCDLIEKKHYRTEWNTIKEWEWCGGDGGAAKPKLAAPRKP